MVELLKSDSDFLNPTISDSATSSDGNKNIATPSDGTVTNKHSATPGDNAPSNDENKTNGNFSGASVQSGDLTDSVRPLATRTKPLNPKRWRGETGNYTGAFPTERMFTEKETH